MTERRPRAVALAVVCGLALACASGRGGPSAQYSDLFEKLPAPDYCVLSSIPATLPDAGELVDVDDLGAELAERAPELRGYALLRLSTPRDSAFYRVDLVETDLAADRAEELEDTVERHLLPAPGEERFSLLAKLDFRQGGPREFTLAVGRAEHCPPRPANRRTVRRLLAQEIETLEIVRRVPADGAEGRRRQPVVRIVPHRVGLRLFVDSTGAVGRAVVRTSSGIPGVDSIALRVAPRMRFRPAMFDRRPTAVWVDQAVTLEMREVREILEGPR